MAKFFVGQRVRIVRATHPQNNGLTGVISHIGPWKYMDILPNSKRLDAESSDCLIELDSARHDGSTSGANSFWQLEPILYDGAQPSEFSYSELMDNLRTKVQEEV